MGVGEVQVDKSNGGKKLRAMAHGKEADVVIIGGGPAGSTAGALLAEMGWGVVILEKEKFPRYHIGESLMPYCYFTFERLGVLEKIAQMGNVKKHSVQFVGRDGRVSTPFYFFQHLNHPAATTWQVWRQDFDAMMLDHARERGVDVREETKVTDFLRNEEGLVTGVRAKPKAGGSIDLKTRLVMDASGRDALWMRKSGWRKWDPKLNKVSIWTLYKGAIRDPGLAEGATTVAYLEGKGWFWNIPLQDDVVSSGIVAERDYLYRDTRDPKAIFEREIRNNPWVEEHLRPGEQFGRYWVTGDYSYRSEYCASDGLVLIGDAFAFLDPVFSSGVFLALKSAEMAADAADIALRGEGPVLAQSFTGYGERLCHAIEVMRKVVYAFYDEGFRFSDLIRSHGDLRGSLTDCLIGNLVDEDYKDLLEAMRQFAEIPASLTHGRARVTASTMG